jgi:hypothetical protein
MRVLKTAIICSLILTGTLNSALSDSTDVSMDSGSKFLYDERTEASIPLTGGTTADGDGAVLQLGYYSNATIADNFAGTWIPLTGEGSLNTAIVMGSSPAESYNRTSIGDLTSQGAGNGEFFMSLVFVEGDPTSGNSFPQSNSTPLALRVYNGTTVASSTFYNVVSDDLWLWRGPATPPPARTISLDDPGLEWLSVTLGQPQNTAFHTTISVATVPEPRSFSLLCLGTLFLPLVRYRRCHQSNTNRLTRLRLQ